jgi:predicted membrane-bound spermidine synthase
MILLLFFCSGVTALVYEVVWSKYLSLMFGSTVQAQTVVLAVFMGGLALGNWLIGRRADWLQQPLAAYGYLELGIGVFAFLFEALFRLADRGFVLLGTRFLEQPGLLLAFKGLLSVTLLLLPTVLMGGTLPLLAAWLRRSTIDPGRWSARFYSINSLGAVCGAGLAGFVLVRSLGLAFTLQATALVNVLVGFTAVGLARRGAGLPHEAAPAAAETLPEAPLPTSIGWTTVVVALTGGVSMGLEVLCSRSLSLIFGASLQAFAIVLMGFILGIGLGSGLVASPRFQRWRSAGAVVALLLAAAGIVGVLVLGIEQWVTVYRYVRSGLAPSTMGYLFHQVIAGVFSVVILGVPAALIGAVLPVCMRLEAGAGEDLGRRVGRLLTWNTLGAVCGVMLTGFVLMPWLGMRNSFVVLATALCLGGVGLGWRGKQPRWLGASSLLAACLVLLGVLGSSGWRHVFSSGVYRLRETEVDRTRTEQRKRDVQILYYQDAADATVSVERTEVGPMPGNMSLRINGKPEASTHLDISTQLLVSHLPLLSRPESKDVFVLGLASGITCGAVLAHPIDQLVVAENCAPVLEAARFFSGWNRGVLTNAHTRIWMEDARTILKLSPKQYDVIVSQPSNPWFASIGSVFSREFYELAARRLKPGGLMVQWFQVYEVHDGIVDLVLRTFGQVFPYMEIWDASAGDIVLVGAKTPWESGVETFRRGYAHEAVRADLARIGLGTPEALLARRFASQRTAAAIVGPGPIQSDAFPILEYDAPRAFFLGRDATRLRLFDERTWQLALMNPADHATLAAESQTVVQGVFTYVSCNPQLQQAVASPEQPVPRQPLPRRIGALTPLMPVAFRFSDSPLLEHVSLQKFTPEARAVYEAERQLREGTGDWRPAIEVIAEALQRQRIAPSVWDVGGYAALAAKEAISHGDTGYAIELLKLGLQLAPADPELGYLVRFLDRETKARPASQPPSARRE